MKTTITIFTFLLSYSLVIAQSSTFTPANVDFDASAEEIALVYNSDPRNNVPLGQGEPEYGGMRWGNGDISFASEYLSGQQPTSRAFTYSSIIGKSHPTPLWQAVAHEFGHNIDYFTIPNFNGYDKVYRENCAKWHVNELRAVKGEPPETYSNFWWNYIRHYFGP